MSFAMLLFSNMFTLCQHELHYYISYPVTCLDLAHYVESMTLTKAQSDKLPNSTCEVSLLFEFPVYILIRSYHSGY